jgi:hypothetical protein
MRLRKRTIIVSAAILVLLTVIPILGQGRLPEELYNYLSKTSGIDLRAVLNEIAVTGLVIAFTIILGDVFEKNTTHGLVASTATRIIWFIVIAFTLSLGDLQHLGLATIGSGNGASFNMVVIDLRLFVFLVAVIIAMKIGYSVLEYRENKAKIPAIQSGT